MTMGMIDSFRYMQNYRSNDIPKTDISVASKQLNSEPQKEENQVKESQQQAISIEPIVDNRPKNANLDEVSLSFNKQESFGYIGKDRDVSLLDMEKAISMMRQDKVLQDYQYFIGNSKDVFNSEDGRVIAKL